MTINENTNQGGASALPIIIADHPLNARDVLRTELAEYQGRKVIGVRKYYRDGEELKPTAKGVTIAIAHLPAMAAAIAKALEAAKANGLLEGGGQ